MFHPDHEYARWRRALRETPLPAACVDMDALDANIKVLREALGGGAVSLRVASKSVRHPALMRHILARGGERFVGLMTFSAHEAAFLAERGFDDLLMGYPVGRRDEASALARIAASGVKITATVDALEQARLLDAAAAQVGATLSVCLDVDASWRPWRGGAHLGVRRSPVRSVADALSVARALESLRHVRLEAVLCYEAQIAGVRDHNPSSAWLDPARRLVKARSKPDVLARRGAIVAALRAEGFKISLVNGGGTGSLSWTAQDPSVTEVTAGSGFLCPHLFDGSGGMALRPAAFFALSVVRRSDRGFVTCAGGGYIASGGVAPDRAPVVHLPVGLSEVGMEGWGEVQTPFKVSRPAGERGLRLGDPVVCRHGKAGELAERFTHYHLLRGAEIVGREPTYRGLGQCFF